MPDAAAQTVSQPATQPSTQPLAPPVAKQVPFERTHHGDTFVDEYEWLRDPESPDTLAYLEAENAYTEARTAHLDGLRGEIFEEIRTRTKETDLSVPYRIGAWWYYGRSHQDKQYGASCRCPARGPDDWTPPALDADVAVPGEQVLLDADVLAEGHEFFSLGGVSVSPDGNLLAYSTDVVGNERYLLRVLDLRTGQLLPDEVPDTMGGGTWDRRGTTLFYTTPDDAWRPDKVWRHVLGTPVGDDAVVFHETDERFWTGIGRTRSDRFIVRASGSRTTSEYAVLDADDPTGEFRVVAPRRDGVEYSVEHAVIAGEDRLLVLHNEDAENYALASAPVDATSPDQWEPLLPHDPAVRLEDVDAFSGHLVLSQRSDGLTQLRIITLDESGLAEDFLVELGEEVHTVGAGGNPEFDQPTVRLGYVTLVDPSGVYDFDVATRELVLLKRTPVLPGPDGTAYDRSRYTQSREWAVAEDGTRVPISMVVPVDAPRDGTMPMVLYGYGSYESSMDPGFSVSRLSLLDRGIGYAIAHVRGGGEMGRHWYDDGKLMRKKNTFTDFIACARHLADSGWTSADRLGAEGASAGGLLMGAVANMAPDAFAAVLAAVPFVDALTTILDPALPLTVIEWDEWGNPLEDPEVYAYMKSYTPYENVTDQHYPAILAETSLNDTRVLFVEPAKWVARLRATVGDSSGILLRTKMSAGHGGVSGRHNSWRERAFSLAWLVDRLVVEPGA
ncbi:MAG: S9 family peptidase [Nocardioidaceae bacterium]